ncbi:hypothetical protein PInf_007923 [Phytophthora infestans]|nr:hypothetical protein PInf_007923 [Phytophthora infestans]
MDKYVVEKVIGEGTYGIVYKAKEKASGDYVAIKKFKSTGDEQMSKREIQACSMLSHPNIVSYRNSFRHEGLLHLVFDYVCGGMVNALEYCHSNRIIHRDVKPDNILIDENGDIKLCDFGVARTVQFEGDPLSDYVSTRWYRPPEQELRLDRYSFDADVWSVGCVLMELLTGRPLFPGNTQIEQINLIQRYLGPLPAALHARVPRELAKMDVILTRAGLSASQQRSLCFDAAKDEVKQTELKLTDAIVSLKRLQDVVRVARDVHNTQRSVVTLPPDAEASVKEMAQSSAQIGPILQDIQCMLNAFTISSRSRGPSGYSTEEEDEEQMTLSMNEGRARQQYLGPPSSDSYRASGLGSPGWSMNPRTSGPKSAAAPSFFRQSEKKVAQVIDGLQKRLSKLSDEGQGNIFSSSIKSALKVARLTQVKGEEASVQIAVNDARSAASELLDRDLSLPDTLDRFEDIRQILAVVVRAATETNGEMEGSELRDLLDLLKNLQDTFPGSAARFKWCSTQLRKFITQKYKRPEHQAVTDKERLSSALAETRGWETVNDYTASRFGDIMTFVSEILEGSYEGWEPRKDYCLAELIGIMIIRLGAFRDSHVQQGRLFDVHGWLYKMSGASFSPSLDLKSVPPPHMTRVYVTPNQGFRAMEDVEEGFDRLSKAKASKSFEFLAITSYTFLATALTTQNRKLLPINELIRFNESLQFLKELNIEGESWAVLQSYQVLEKILYLMRLLIHQHPEYVEISGGEYSGLM